jgi:hypothetical protein
VRPDQGGEPASGERNLTARESRADERDVDVEDRLFATEERERKLTLRSRLLDERELRADERDAAMARRANLADERDRWADLRDDAADERERIADQREIDEQLLDGTSGAASGRDV